MQKRSSSAVDSDFMVALTLRACAKVNLSLYVTGKRCDGMHDLVSVFASVNLSDEIHLTVDDGHSASPSDNVMLSISTDCPLIRGQDIPTGSNNLIFKADREWRSVHGSLLPLVNYKLHKNIPSLSGLGGGSADCAAVLRGLNFIAEHHLATVPLSSDRLDQIALSLGADVPFCLKGGFSLGEGVGENLSPLGTISDTFHILLIRPYEGIETGAAFTEIDKRNSRDITSRNEAVSRCRKLAIALSKGAIEDVASLIHSDFLKPFLDKSSVNKDLFEKIHLMSSGACGLSGSGSVFFALFDDLSKLSYAKKIISSWPEVSWIEQTSFADKGVLI
jgi:4-diphosphocytidyl-2-C-methyl-D-erythritol kinase